MWQTSRRRRLSRRDVWVHRLCNEDRAAATGDVDDDLSDDQGPESTLKGVCNKNSWILHIDRDLTNFDSTLIMV